MSTFMRFVLSARLRVAGTIFSVAALALAWLPGALEAQLSSASVTGVVRDATGSVVPETKLTLRNVDTNITHTTQSNNAGNYVFLNITPGRYTLEATQTGFRTNRISTFGLEVNQTATIDVTLELGAVEQTLTVEAAGEAVQSSTAELGSVVATRQVNDLPLNGRNFTQLLSLTPGVAPVSVSQNSGGFGNVATGTQVQFPAINGQTNRSNFFMTDGLNNQGAFSSTYAVPPIVDAMEEFKVNAHNDLAEFGGALGGIVNVVTKSGTNDVHGSLWEYVRNDAFNARNTFQQSVTPFRQNEFGGAVGGPVWIPKLYNGRNKTFFFFAYQGLRYSQKANSFFRVPTDANLNGDFSDEPRQIFNPFSTRPDPNKPGSFIRDPFTGNQIPAGLIDQRMVTYARTVLPRPVFTGVSDRNAFDPTPIKQQQNEYSGRIDQNFGTKDFVWFRYSEINLDQSLPGGLPGLVNNKTNPGQNYGGSYVHTFSPSLVLQAQYGRSHQETNGLQRFRNLPSGFIQTLGFSNSFAGGFIDGSSFLPSLGVSGFFGAGESNSLNPNETNVHQYKANVSKIIGSHTLRFGGELNTSGFESFYESANVGFNTQQTSNPENPSQIGSALASFLLNVPDSAGRRNVHETTRWGGVMGYYFQDNWKATPKLTVNLGLRYDRTFIPPYGKENTVGKQGGIEAGSLNLNNGTYVLQKLPPSCAQRGFAPCIPTPDGSLPAHVVVDPRGKIYHDTTTNWGPRIGLAYRLRQSTALRASFGVYYDNWAAVTQTSQNYEGTWPDVGQQLANNLNNPVPGAPTPTIKTQAPFVNGLFPAPTPFDQVQWYADPYAKNPYSMQWNFGVEHELNRSSTVTVNYVGSGNRRLDVGGYNNVALTPGPGNPQDRAPYPYIHPTYYDRSIGRGNYQAFQFLLNRRFSKGLAYQVAYTYSKTIDEGASGWYGVEGQSVQDPYHINNDRSVAAFDLTHVLTFNLVYELPIGKGKAFQTGNGLLDHVIGNWQVNTITLARSGLPFNVVVSGDPANTGNTGNYERANLVGNPSISNPSRDQWFNRAAFAVPAQYTFGNLGRDRLRSDPLWNIDVSMFRQFPVFETRRIEFRAEAFNVVNNVVYGTPTGDITSTNFGKVLGVANSPRSLQLGLKIIF